MPLLPLHLLGFAGTTFAATEILGSAALHPLPSLSACGTFSPCRLQQSCCQYEATAAAEL